ncbi:hypothetical protein ACFW5D_34320 [Streptomyces sp. NPDC058770]|uniref:hypothetical protein n=1 Tax=Streptomyces sp. NPDC058770 TaxID=3346631 RepID=UPI0036C4E209
MPENVRVPGRKETNVRLPVCAHEALATIAARQGTSRDETVRRLLSDHVEEQERKDPEDRRTHLSTLLRYPPPPRWRKDPRQDRPLRLRADATLLERAKAVSLRLPGQHRRAHRDYQGRMLTDAVMTAIAVAEPFTDSFLDGLLPLLRQRSALGLWRLVTAATSTGPEETYLVTAGTIRADAWMSDTPLGAGREYLLRVAEHLEREEGWHSSERFKRAVSLARGLLTGPQAKECEHWLYAQDEDFEEVYQDLLQEDDGRGKHVRRGYDWTGRGGTAVWRAERRVDLEDFEDWLVGRGTGDSSVGVMESGSPGWLLSTPPAWQAQAFPRTAATPLREMGRRRQGPGLSLPERTGHLAAPARQARLGLGTSARD